MNTAQNLAAFSSMSDEDLTALQDRLAAQPFVDPRVAMAVAAETSRRSQLIPA